VDVLILFAALFGVAALVVFVLARRPGPTPAGARGTEPANERAAWDRTVDRAADPGAEGEAVVDRGSIGPAPPPTRAERRQS